MSLENEKKPYTAEQMKTKMLLQIEIMSQILGANSSEEEKLRWISESSSKYGDYFDQVKDDEEFISKAGSNPKELASEIIFEIFPESVHRIAA